MPLSLQSLRTLPKIAGFFNGLPGKIAGVMLVLSLVGGWYHSQLQRAAERQKFIDQIAVQKSAALARSRATPLVPFCRGSLSFFGGPNYFSVMRKSLKSRSKAESYPLTSRKRGAHIDDYRVVNQSFFWCPFEGSTMEA